MASADQEASGLAALNRAVWDRRAEYVHSRQIRIKVGSWNVAAIEGTEKDIGGWFVSGKGVLDLSEKEAGDVESFADQESRRTNQRSTLPLHGSSNIPSGDAIGLYVLGLQEMVDVSNPTETIRPYYDKTPSERWKSALLKAMPKGYSLVAEQQLVGLFVLIYASPSVVSDISNVSCRAVGTGLMGSMGNKGAVSVRIVLGETSKIVFVNSHLAAGAQPQNLERRNWDASMILERTRFSAIDRGHGVVDELEDSIGEEDFAFWFGDLNYRLADLPGDDIRRILTRHTQELYERDASLHAEQDAPENNDDEQDPASLETTLSSLLPHDELRNQIRQRKAFHQGWQEGKISFLPTYKYDIGSVGAFDSSEKKRAPSWCDRILYRSRRHLQDFKRSVSPVSTTAGSATGAGSAELQGQKDTAAETGTQSEQFDYDPEEDGYQPSSGSDHGEGDASQEDGSSDSIELEHYVSHQRVLSSDHKPLDAIFKLTYTSVDPEKKAAINREVARDFDRKENDSRPTLSVAVETLKGTSSRELIDFGEIHTGQKVSRSITVANTGPVDVNFGFVLQQGDGSPRPWLKIDCDHSPLSLASIDDVASTYCISPGDSWTATASIDAEDPSTAQQIPADLEDIMVLRVLDGGDHFLTLKGSLVGTKKEEP